MGEKYEGILIVAEAYEGRIHHVAYELLGKAAEIAAVTGEKISCLVLTDRECGAAELCYRGADAVYVMTSADFAEAEECVFAENISSFIREYRPSAVLTGATFLDGRWRQGWRQLLGRV